MKWNWIGAALTDTGMRRKENQDEPIYSPRDGLYALADGMGGVSYGKKTAQIVGYMLTSVARQLAGQELEPEELARTLGESIGYISENIYGMGNTGAVPAYGATLTGFVRREDMAVVFNVGDSRVYLLDSQGGFRQITRDHSVVQILVDNGELTPEEARTHPARSTVTRYMGDIPPVVPDMQILPLAEGDRWLVCSDGLHGMVPPDAIREILARGDDPQEICRELVRAANEAGGADNITVVVMLSVPEEARETGEAAEAEPVPQQQEPAPAQPEKQPEPSSDAESKKNEAPSEPRAAHKRKHRRGVVLYRVYKVPLPNGRSYSGRWRSGKKRD